VFSATFNNISVISWRSVLLVEETGVSGENHRPAEKSYFSKTINEAESPFVLENNNMSTNRRDTEITYECILLMMVI